MELTDREFWALTPREYRALVDRHEERERRSDVRFGQVCSLVANALGMKTTAGAGYGAADFFPSLRATPGASSQAGPQRTEPKVVDDSIAEGWLVWARTANEAAARRGLPSQESPI